MDAYEIFENWLLDQPCWLQEASVLLSKKEILTDKEYDKLLALCLTDTKNIKENSRKFYKGCLLEKKQGISFNIIELKEMIGINAISQLRPLPFNENGITIIYGENGAGKSGYVKTFKKLSGARYKEPLLSNVYEPISVSPSCTVLINDGKLREIKCDLSESNLETPLKGMDIFDTSVSEAYIGKSNEASYEPWIFKLITSLINIADRLRDNIDEKIRNIETGIFNIPEELEDTPVGKFIKNLTYKSDVESLEIIWNENKLNDLKQIEHFLNEESPELKLIIVNKQIENLGIIIEKIELYINFMKSEDMNNIKNQYFEWVKSFKIKEETRKILSNEIENYKINNETWMKMWEAARKFSNEKYYHHDQFPVVNADSVCVLCHQKLTEDTKIHLMKLEEYVQNDFFINEKMENVKLIEYINKFPAIVSEQEVRLMMDNCDFLSDDEISEITSFFDSIRNIRNELLFKNPDYLIPEIDEKTVYKIISTNNEKLCFKKSKFLLMTTDSEILLKESIHKNLNSEKYYIENKENIKNYINILREIEDLKNARKQVVTNKLTTKNNEMAKLLLTDEYIKRFNDELKLLTKNSINVSLTPVKGGKGKIPFKIKIDNADGTLVEPNMVLSEGEKRIVSLAAFFADSNGNIEKSPLIFDDPISSLDTFYEEKVVERLVMASQNRQVIIFTHRISLVVGISDKCKTEMINAEEVHLIAWKYGKGNPILKALYTGKIIGKLNSLLNEQLSDLRKKEETCDDQIEIITRYMCQQIRIIIEQCVEELLINDVVKRFRKDIQTKNRINGLSIISSDDCSLIDNYMTKYSYYEHSNSQETPIKLPLSDELEKDLILIINWVKEYQTKLKSV